MPNVSSNTAHHAAVAQHHDYADTLMDQLLDIANQLASLAMQLKEGHQTMGAQIEESLNNLHNEPSPNG